MAAHEILPWLLTPRTRGWIVGPNYSLANKIAREVKRIIMTELKLPIESKKEISGDLYYMKLAGLGSELSVKSAENQESLIGEGIDYLCIDEAALIPRNVFEMYLRPTLSDRQRWAMFTSTPRGFNFLHYLYELVRVVIHEFYGGPYASNPTTALSGHAIPRSAPKALHSHGRRPSTPPPPRARTRAA